MESVANCGGVGLASPARSAQAAGSDVTWTAPRETPYQARVNGHFSSDNKRNQCTSAYRDEPVRTARFVRWRLLNSERRLSQVPEHVRERWHTARVLADVIGEELNLARSDQQHPVNQRILDQAKEVIAAQSNDAEIAELQERIKDSWTWSIVESQAESRADAVAVAEVMTRLSQPPQVMHEFAWDNAQEVRALLTRIVQAPELAKDDQSRKAGEFLFLLCLREAESALESAADFETRLSAFQILSDRLAELMSRGYVPDTEVLERIQKSPAMSPFVRSFRSLLRSLQRAQPDLTIVQLVANDAVRLIADRVSQVAGDYGSVPRVVSVFGETPTAMAVRSAAEEAMSGMTASEALPIVLAASSTREHDARQRVDDAVAAAAHVAPVVLLAERFDADFNNLALKHHSLFVSMHGLETDALLAALRLDNNWNLVSKQLVQPLSLSVADE
jgi:hypothetical protein